MNALKHQPSVAAKALLLLGLCGLAGCANPIHFKDDMGVGSVNTPVKTQILSLDAKQRVVVYSTRNDGKNDFTVTCAEPSPDALSAISANLGGNIQNGAGAAASLSAAAAESAASIGLRTQSIQLLRDGMYRSCEAYAAGAISKEEFNRQQRRYQNLMLSLLAIEQISGAVVARQVGLGGGVSSASSGEAANEAAEALTKADSAAEAAQKELDAAKKKQKEDQDKCATAADQAKEPACGNKTANEEAVTSKADELKTTQKKQETAKQALAAARAAVRSAATGATVSFAPETHSRNNVTDSSVKYVAEAARTIVSTTLLASFAQEDCSRMWDFVEANLTDFSTQNALIAAAKTEAEKDQLKALGARNIFNLMTAKPVQKGEIKAEDADGQDLMRRQFAKLMEGCSRSQELLRDKATLLEPQYFERKSEPLKVLGGDEEIVFSPKDPARDLVIVGGVPPYAASVTASFGTAKELTATTGQKDMKSVVRMTRPDGAAAEGHATIYVVDAVNAYAAVRVKLAGKKKDQPDPGKKVEPDKKGAKAP